MKKKLTNISFKLKKKNYGCIFNKGGQWAYLSRKILE